MLTLAWQVAILLILALDCTYCSRTQGAADRSDKNLASDDVIHTTANDNLKTIKTAVVEPGADTIITSPDHQPSSGQKLSRGQDITYTDTQGANYVHSTLHGEDVQHTTLYGENVVHTTPQDEYSVLTALQNEDMVHTTVQGENSVRFTNKNDNSLHTTPQGKDMLHTTTNSGYTPLLSEILDSTDKRNESEMSTNQHNESLLPVTNTRKSLMPSTKYSEGLRPTPEHNQGLTSPDGHVDSLPPTDIYSESILSTTKHNAGLLPSTTHEGLRPTIKHSKGYAHTVTGHEDVLPSEKQHDGFMPTEKQNEGAKHADNKNEGSAQAAPQQQVIIHRGQAQVRNTSNTTTLAHEQIQVEDVDHTPQTEYLESTKHQGRKLVHSTFKDKDMVHTTLQDKHLIHTEIQGADSVHTNKHGDDVVHTKKKDDDLAHTTKQNVHTMHTTKQGVDTVHTTKHGVDTVHTTKQGVDTMHTTKQGVDTMHTTKQGVDTVHTTKQGVNKVHTTRHGVDTLHTTKQGVDAVHTTKQGVDTVRTTKQGVYTVHTTKQNVDTMHTTKLGADTVRTTKLGVHTVHTTQQGENLLLTTKQDGHLMHVAQDKDLAYTTTQSKDSLHTTTQSEGLLHIATHSEELLHSTKDAGNLRKQSDNQASMEKDSHKNISNPLASTSSELPGQDLMVETFSTYNITTQNMITGKELGVVNASDLSSSDMELLLADFPDSSPDQHLPEANPRPDRMSKFTNKPRQEGGNWQPSESDTDMSSVGKKYPLDREMHTEDVVRQTRSTDNKLEPDVSELPLPTEGPPDNDKPKVINAESAMEGTYPYSSSKYLLRNASSMTEQQTPTIAMRKGNSEDIAADRHDSRTAGHSQSNLTSYFADSEPHSTSVYSTQIPLTHTTATSASAAGKKTSRTPVTDLGTPVALTVTTITSPLEKASTSVSAASLKATSSLNQPRQELSTHGKILASTLSWSPLFSVEKTNPALGGMDSTASSIFREETTLLPRITHKSISTSASSSKSLSSSETVGQKTSSSLKPTQGTTSAVTTVKQTTATVITNPTTDREYSTTTTKSTRAVTTFSSAIIKIPTTTDRTRIPVLTATTTKVPTATERTRIPTATATTTRIPTTTATTKIPTTERTRIPTTTATTTRIPTTTATTTRIPTTTATTTRIPTTTTTTTKISTTERTRIPTTTATTTRIPTTTATITKIPTTERTRILTITEITRTPITTATTTRIPTTTERTRLPVTTTTTATKIPTTERSRIPVTTTRIPTTTERTRTPVTTRTTKTPATTERTRIHVTTATTTKIPTTKERTRTPVTTTTTTKTPTTKETTRIPVKTTTNSTTTLQSKQTTQPAATSTPTTTATPYQTSTKTNPTPAITIPTKPSMQQSTATIQTIADTTFSITNKPTTSRITTTIVASTPTTVKTKATTTKLTTPIEVHTASTTTTTSSATTRDTTSTSTTTKATRYTTTSTIRDTRTASTATTNGIATTSTSTPRDIAATSTATARDIATASTATKGGLATTLSIATTATIDTVTPTITTTTTRDTRTHPTTASTITAPPPSQLGDTCSIKHVTGIDLCTVHVAYSACINSTCHCVWPRYEWDRRCQEYSLRDPHVRVSHISQDRVTVTWSHGPINNVQSLTYRVSWRTSHTEQYSGSVLITGQYLPGSVLLTSSYIVDKLLPATEYTFTISAIITSSHPGNGALELLLPPAVVRTVSAPPSQPRAEAVNSSHILLTWSPPEHSGVIKYRIIIVHVRSDHSEEDHVEKIITFQGYNLSKYMVPDLQPYSNYSFNISTLTDAGQSRTVTVGPVMTKIGVPSPPRGLKCTYPSAGTILLSWETADERAGPTTVQLFALRAKHSDVSLGFEFFKNITLEDHRRSVTLTGLNHFWHYIFSMSASTTAGQSETVTLLPACRTSSTAPGPVHDLHMQSASVTSAWLLWDCPIDEDRHGILERFTIYQIPTLFRDDLDKRSITNQNFQVSAGLEPCLKLYNVSVTVIPDVTYIFQVQPKVVGVDQLGEAQSQVFHAPAAIPAPIVVLPTSRPYTNESSLNESTFTLNICRSCLLDNSHGQVYAFGILVCLDGFCDQSFHELQDWKTIYSGLSTWKTAQSAQFETIYRATNRSWEIELQNRVTTNGGDDVIFEVGGDTSCASRPDRVHCNGPLPAGQSFRVRLFSCTKGGCRLSQPSGLFMTAEPASKPSSDVVVIGGAAAGAAVAAIVILAVVIVRLRFREPNIQGKPTSKFGGKEVARVVALTDLNSSNKREAHRPITIEEFERVLQCLHARENALLVQEFADLNRQSPQHPTEVGNDLAFRHDNRWTNILPYDHSRVKLTSTSRHDACGHDYINANYIPGIDSNHDYIATQGPLTRTVPDFWRMVWEQKVAAIVMLSDFDELDKRTQILREKVAHYFPDHKSPSAHYGLIQVTETEMVESKYWEIRTFKLVNSRARKARSLKHYFFKRWSDHEADIDPCDLIDFIEVLRADTSTLPHTPLVVHCSAGVGRTGTFMAVDYFYQQLIQCKTRGKTVDIFGRVLNMRESRRFMVQSVTQYIFIYDAVKEIIKRVLQLTQHTNLSNKALNHGSTFGLGTVEDAVYDDVEFLQGQLTADNGAV